MTTKIFVRDGLEVFGQAEVEEIERNSPREKEAELVLDYTRSLEGWYLAQEKRREQA